MTSLLPPAKVQFSDTSGNPLAGGSVEFFTPNTSVHKTTWQDSGQVTPNANPLTLDAAGEAIIFGSGQYRQLVKDASGNTIWDQLTMELTPVLSGTSTTSNAIGTGSLTFTTQSGIAFSVGQYVIILDSSNAANYVSGQITAYSGTSLTINSTTTGGSGTKTSWNIYLSGGIGPSGPAGTFNGTSSTSLTVGTGTKTFTTQSGLSFAPGMFVAAISSGTPASYMVGNVTSYSGTTLVLNSTTIGTVNTLSDWNLALSGPPASTSSRISTFLVADTTDIVLSAAPTQTNVGATVSITFPTKGAIELSFYGELVNTTASQDLILGIRIGSTNYFPTYVDGGGTNYLAAAHSDSGTQVLASLGAYNSASNGAGYSLNYMNTAVTLNIEQNSIPTGAQTVQVIAAVVHPGGGTCTIKGTAVTTRIRICVYDHT